MRREPNRRSQGDSRPFRLDTSDVSNALGHEVLGLGLGIEVVDAYVGWSDNEPEDLPVGLDAAQPAIAALTTVTAVTITNLFTPS